MAIDNILLATDLSVYADRALDRAIRMATRLKAHLHIIHVAPSFQYPEGRKPERTPAMEARALLDSWVEQYADSQPAASVQVIEGDPVVEILSAARKIKADLIVMGMHNKDREGLRDMFIGTTIERVIRRGDFSVLMVKNKATGAYKKVMVGTDFGPCSRKSFRIATQIVPEAAFHIIHMYDMPFGGFMDRYAQEEIRDAAQQGLAAFIAEEQDWFRQNDRPFPEKITSAVAEDIPLSGIISKAKSSEVDLITLGAHGKAGPAPSFFGTTAIEVMKNPPCDVLVAKGSFK